MVTELHCPWVSGEAETVEWGACGRAELASWLSESRKREGGPRDKIYMQGCG